MCETVRRFGEYLIELARQGYGAELEAPLTRGLNAVPEPERRHILLRAYAEPISKEPRSKTQIAPEFVLIFDTETTTDESQRLRFGTYQIWQKGRCARKGLFYDKVTDAELETLKAEAPKHGCAEPPFCLHDFVHKRFLPTAFKAGGLIVGLQPAFRFVAPRDPSRSCAGLSIRAGPKKKSTPARH